ncbi:Thiosulfate sulfurtransferase/rhodanese-like domain-containing protein 3 [Holothuria leucospilota]|uniref:Thiosulfate sulfurtransferase/rhodanese-like domain-containing protein 3 n=1 Tax=Holothuria leucospilota TaxID=206669 RepID=A0A9Q1H319_HOLLE|nr:Thiosulfate sulfurtransferase/rhodanese-like domain-containing protein 3 [Holothuria leucospilota]
MALQIQRFLVQNGGAVFSRVQGSKYLPVASLYVTATTVNPTMQSRCFQSQPVVFQRKLFRDQMAVCLVRQQTLHNIRCWSSSTSESDSGKNVSYEEMTKLIDNKEIIIIDVREPFELAQTGLIGDSINIPLGDLHSAFSLSREDFRERYKVSKPSSEDDNVVLHCLAGIRSQTGLNILQGLGFDKFRHYPGGWEEWMEKKVSRR